MKKIAVCGSMFASGEIMECVKALQGRFDVIFPIGCDRYAEAGVVEKEDVGHKINNDVIRGYFEKMKDCDAVLIVNADKSGIKGYVGGNTFLEMGFVYVLGKDIYLLNDIPNISYRDEIEAMSPVVINGDLSLIK